MVVLRIKDHTLLNLIHRRQINLIVSNRQLLNAEVGFERMTNLLSSDLGYLAMEDFQFNYGLIIINELSYRIRAKVGYFAISDYQLFQNFVLFQRRT